MLQLNAKSTYIKFLKIDAILINYVDIFIFWQLRCIIDFTKI